MKTFASLLCLVATYSAYSLSFEIIDFEPSKDNLDLLVGTSLAGDIKLEAQKNFLQNDNTNSSLNITMQQNFYPENNNLCAIKRNDLRSSTIFHQSAALMKLTQSFKEKLILEGINLQHFLQNYLNNEYILSPDESKRKEYYLNAHCANEVFSGRPFSNEKGSLKKNLFILQEDPFVFVNTYCTQADDEYELLMNDLALIGLGTLNGKKTVWILKFNPYDNVKSFLPEQCKSPKNTQTQKKRKRRTVLSAKTKNQALQRAENGESVSDLAKEYGVTTKTVYGWKYTQQKKQKTSKL